MSEKSHQQSIEEDISALQKRHGNRINAEDEIQDNDLVTFAVKELDGDAIKEDGLEAEFKVLTSRVNNEELKAELMRKKTGDTLKVNIFEIEEDTSEDYVKKYFLNLEDEDMDIDFSPFFEATIGEVNRVIPAELNQELFDKEFGEGVINSAEELKDKLKEDLSNYYQVQTEAVLFRKIQEVVLEKNKENMPLPDDFLKRWLVASSENNTVELIEKEYDSFAQNLRWSLIKGKIARTNEIKVEEAEIRNHIGNQIAGYMSQYGGAMPGMEGFLGQMVERAMSDDKQVRQAAEAIIDDKVFDTIRNTVTIQENGISIEDFNKVVDDIRAQDAADRMAAEAIAAEEEDILALEFCSRERL